MWPLVLLALAVISTALWFKYRESGYKLHVLACISAGAAVMALVDALFSYIEEGVFVEVTLENLLLSIILVLAALAMWLIVLGISKLKKSF